MKNEIETKNEELVMKNNKLKERIKTINQHKFTKNVHTNLNKISENLNVETCQNLNVETSENLHVEDQFKFNVEHFNCYQCENTFKTLKLLMTHRKSLHKTRTKCRNVQTCKYFENCWFSHENNNEDTESIKSYITT